MRHLIRNSRAGLFIVCSIALLCFGAWPAFAQRLPQTVVPEHYNLTLTPDLAAATFTGEETIDVRLQQPLDSITLNAAEISFQSVSAMVNGQKLSAKVALDAQKEQATFSFDKQLAAGPVTLSIQYSGILNDQLRGFYLSRTAKRNYAVTQFEATDARRAFPCFDEPAYKATFDVTLIVNKGDTAISNTNIVSDAPGPLADEHTIRFATTPKMSTYLVAFLVGDFQCVSGESDGIPIRACATPGNARMGEYAVSAAEFFLHYYNQYFGIKNPMPKLDMIAIPDFEAGAMENFGAITYRETALLVDEKTASILQKQTVAVDVAHEMAHQWFGDMVTMQWWNNLWLNEGFATWMENKAVAAWQPDWRMPQSVEADLQKTLDLDSRAETRTIRAEAETPAQINQMFDGITYGKAGAVLLMVENYVGDETFRRGVHDYLASHIYANATAEDFWNAQTEVSHKPVDRIMSSFVTEPGVPLLSFSGFRENTVTVSQQRFFLNPRSADKAVQIWTVPVCVDAERGGATCFVVSAGAPTIPATRDKLFFANAGGKGYYRSSYTAEEYARLEAGIESELTPEERMSLLGDELALVHAGKAGVGDYLDLVFAVRDDSSNYVVSGGIDGATAVEQMIAGDDQERAAMARWIQRTFGPALARLGDPVPGEPLERSQLRAALFGVLGGAGRDPQVIARARQLASEYLDNQGSVDATLAPAALTIAAANGDAAFFDQLQRVYETSKNSQMQASALTALGVFKDPTLERRTLDYVASGKVRNQDSNRLLGRMLSNVETRDVAWQYIEANWSQIAAQLTKWGGTSMVAGASSFCTVQARAQVTSFFASHPVPGADRALARDIDQINDCIALRTSQEPALKIWLQAQNK
jgi:aminopeptidase N